MEVLSSAWSRRTAARGRSDRVAVVFDAQALPGDGGDDGDDAGFVAQVVDGVVEAPASSVCIRDLLHLGTLAVPLFF